MLYPKKILKKEESINNERIIIWVFSFKIEDKSFTGRNPPEEINVNAKFNESKVRNENKFKIMKIINVNVE